MKKILLISIAILIPTQSNAELGWGFKSPAFNGNGYSSHVLSTEQLLFNRQSEIRDKAEAEERANEGREQAFGEENGRMRCTGKSTSTMAIRT